jgi:hypothetical protein
MVTTTITLVAVAVADLHLAMAVAMAALAVAVAALRRLALVVWVGALLATLALLAQPELLEQTAVQAEQIQVAVQAQEILLTQAQLEMVALELSLFAT